MQPEAVIQGLIDRGMPPHLAYGFAGNFAVESEFNPDLNERAPLIPGSRGGYGLAQWTGPRRLQLEDFAEQRGVPVSDMDMQLDFLMSELQGSENRAWQAIQAAQDPAEAARLVSEEFLRPGIPHLDRRINTALQLAGMEPQTMQFDATGTPQQPRGFLGGIFGGQQRPDPNAGSPTDPFANLSRAQRTMLGFAALRDAAASLEGRDSNYFNSALGGFEAARERERLRAQGEMANRNDAIFRIFQLQYLAGQPGYESLQPLIDAELQVLMGNMPPGGAGVAPRVTTGTTPRVVPAGGAPGATPSVVRPADQVLADLDLALDPETGGVNADGTPFETPEPVVTPSELPTEAAPTPVAEPDVAAPTETPAPQSTILDDLLQERDQNNALIAQLEEELEAAIEQYGQAETGAGIGLPTSPGMAARRAEQIQSNINNLRDRNGALAQQIFEERQTAREAQAQETAVAEQQQATEQENRSRAMDVVGPRIDAALDFLISGYDEQGQPVLNPMLTTMGGIRTLELSNPAAYRQYVNALQTLAADTLIETLNRATFGALNESEMRVAMGYEGSLDPTDPYGTLQTLLQMRRNFEEISGQPGTGQTTGISNGADDGLSEEDQALIDRYTQ